MQFEVSEPGIQGVFAALNAAPNNKNRGDGSWEAIGACHRLVTFDLRSKAFEII